MGGQSSPVAGSTAVIVAWKISFVVKICIRRGEDMSISLYSVTGVNVALPVAIPVAISRGVVAEKLKPRIGTTLTKEVTLLW
jgi:hypothetical protein